MFSGVIDRDQGYEMGLGVWLYELKIALLLEKSLLSVFLVLTLPGRKEKINLKFCFRTSLWYLKRF